MKIKEIRLGKTFNMDTFEIMRIELVADVEEDENLQYKLTELSIEINKFRKNYNG